jgi:peptide/nickel transport system substrate-binding protein
LGGTLRVGGGAAHDPFQDPEGRRAFDPQWEVGILAYELYRCCLLRTLLSYSGRPAAEGGAQLQPDLAAAMPEISADGLTWTFRLKRGLRYGPPLQHMEIVAADLIRALERTLTPAGGEAGGHLGAYSPYYEPVIEGARAFAAGQAQRISGLEAPDTHTLVVRLAAPNGDLGYLLALPAAAPIPPLPGDATARLGIATGHAQGFGQRFVSSGPYMFEGSEALDFSLPAAEQPPVSGWVPFESMTLVRNPSWDRATDALRAAHVDRIEVTLGFTILQDPPEAIEALLAAVDRGDLDLLLDIDTPPERMAAYLGDPARADRVHVVDADVITFLPLNLAQPPFDDVHVRRAVNYAIDRASLLGSRLPIRLIGPWAGHVHNHLAPDSVLDNLLLRYEPFPSDGGSGDLAAARAEMAASAYDTDRDGVCDAPACRGVPTLVNPRPGTEAVAAAVAEDLKAIGIELALEQGEFVNFFDRLYDGAAHIALAVDIAFIKDYPSPDTFFTSLFYRGSQGEYWNPMAIGVRPDELEAFGYEPLDIPNVDARIEACHAQVGRAQLECWAELDQYLTEALVVAVPFGSFQSTRHVSDRIEAFSFDQFTSAPALDQISLLPD